MKLRHQFALAGSVLMAAFASSPAAAADVPHKTTSLVVYGNDPCPKGAPDEIVVCAHRPDNERYRIPKELRARRKDEHGGTSWTSQWAAAEDQTRFTRPNSCSVVGSGGQTGCFRSMLRDWTADRQQIKQDQADIP